MTDASMNDLINNIYDSLPFDSQPTDMAWNEIIKKFIRKQIDLIHVSNARYNIKKVFGISNYNFGVNYYNNHANNYAKCCEPIADIQYEEYISSKYIETILQKDIRSVIQKYRSSFILVPSDQLVKIKVKSEKDILDKMLTVMFIINLASIIYNTRYVFLSQNIYHINLDYKDWHSDRRIKGVLQTMRRNKLKEIKEDNWHDTFDVRRFVEDNIMRDGSDLSLDVVSARDRALDENKYSRAKMFDYLNNCYKIKNLSYRLNKKNISNMLSIPDIHFLYLTISALPPPNSEGQADFILCAIKDHALRNMQSYNKIFVYDLIQSTYNVKNYVNENDANVLFGNQADNEDMGYELNASDRARIMIDQFINNNIDLPLIKQIDI